MKTLEQHWLDMANSQDKSDPCWSDEYSFPRPKPTVWAAPWEYTINMKHGRGIYRGRDKRGVR